MAHDWDIKTRGEACGSCEQPFADEQQYLGTLVFGEEGYSRSDYCQKCWDSKDEQLQIYSVWHGVFKMPPPPEEEALKKETAESLLRKLIEDDDPTKGNVIYILAVMLERKKILIERDVKIEDDGRMVRVYEHRKTGETFVVRDPKLQLDELEGVQEEVVLMLGGKPPARPDAEATPVEETDEDDDDEDDDDDGV